MESGSSVLPEKLDWNTLESRDDSEKLGEVLTPQALKEYFHLQSIVDGYNKDCLTIKSWSVTVSAVALGVGIQRGLPLLAVVAGITSLAFWLAEGYWRANQWAFIQRIREIELRRHMYSPLISYGWANYFEGWMGRTGFLQARCAVPHVLILLSALAFALCMPEPTCPGA